MQNKSTKSRRVKNENRKKDEWKEIGKNLEVERIRRTENKEK